MGKGIGNGFGLYVSAEAPTNGSEGDISEYDLVGFDKDLNFPTSRNMIDASDKDSGGDSEFKPGRRTRTVDGTFNWDEVFDNDAGQKVLKDSVDADTESDALLYFLITDNVTGNEQTYGQGYCSSFDRSFPDEGMTEISATIQVDGAVTTQAVTT